MTSANKRSQQRYNLKYHEYKMNRYDVSNSEGKFAEGSDKEVVHVELILIHPFREGNGRLSRLLADVMAVQAGFQPLDYESWTQHPEQYIAAIHAGLNLNYEPMKYWVNEALKAN